MVLSGKKIEFEVVDISSSTDVKDKMRAIAGDPKALPPQICNGEQYCGVNKCFTSHFGSYTFVTFLTYANPLEFS